MKLLLITLLLALTWSSFNSRVAAEPDGVGRDNEDNDVAEARGRQHVKDLLVETAYRVIDNLYKSLKFIKEYEGKIPAPLLNIITKIFFKYLAVIQEVTELHQKGVDPSIILDKVTIKLKNLKHEIVELFRKAPKGFPSNILAVVAKALTVTAVAVVNAVTNVLRVGGLENNALVKFVVSFFGNEDKGVIGTILKPGLIKIVSVFDALSNKILGGAGGNFLTNLAGGLGGAGGVGGGLGGLAGIAGGLGGIAGGLGGGASAGGGFDVGAGAGFRETNDDDGTDGV